MSEKEDALAARLEEKRQRTGSLAVSMKAEEIHGGVSIGWLAEVFNMGQATVRTRLAECPVLRVTKQGTRYSLPIAAQYLVKPRVDIQKYLKRMRPEELPSHLQDQFWSAQLKKQKHEENSGDLWRTQKVMDVFAEVFLMMKSTMLLWTEDVERAVGLTEDQRKVLVKLVDSLQSEIHDKLCEGKIGDEVKPVQTEIETPNDPFQPVGVIDDDYEDLI